MNTIGGYDDFGYWNPIYSKTIDRYLYMDSSKRLYSECVEFLIVTEEKEKEMQESFDNWGYKRIGEYEGLCNYDVNLTNIPVIIYQNSDNANGFIRAYNSLKETDAIENKKIIETINETDVDIRKTAVIQSEFYNDIKNHISSNSEKIEYKILSNTCNKVECSVKSTGDTLAVISVINEPGWKIYIDGKQVKKYEANFDRIAVLIGEGNHNVKLIYCPNEMIFGLFILIISIITIVYFYVSEKYIKYFDGQVIYSYILNTDLLYKRM